MRKIASQNRTFIKNLILEACHLITQRWPVAHHSRALGSCPSLRGSKPYDLQPDYNRQYPSPCIRAYMEIGCSWCDSHLSSGVRGAACSRRESLQVLRVLCSRQPVSAELCLSIRPHAHPGAIALERPGQLGPGRNPADEGRLQHGCIHGCSSCLPGLLDGSCCPGCGRPSCDKAPIWGRAILGFRPFWLQSFSRRRRWLQDR